MAPLIRSALVLLLLAKMACRPFGPDLPLHPQAPQPESRVSAHGLVVGVERPGPEDSQSYVHVLIAPSGKQPIRLILAPGWYLDRQGIRFEPQESVTAEGKRTSYQGSPSIMVERISTTRGSYELRDAREQPAWGH